MSASERFDEALKGFRHALEMLGEPGHLTRTVHQRSTAGRTLREVRVERCVEDTEPFYGPTYYVREPSHH